MVSATPPQGATFYSWCRYCGCEIRMEEYDHWRHENSDRYECRESNLNHLERDVYDK